MQEIKQLNAITLQEQLYNELATQIKSGKYKPGDRIPPELKLSEIYRVSRVTVRCYTTACQRGPTYQKAWKRNLCENTGLHRGILLRWKFYRYMLANESQAFNTDYRKYRMP